jgi:hypothetical protein
MCRPGRPIFALATIAAVRYAPRQSGPDPGDLGWLLGSEQAGKSESIDTHGGDKMMNTVGKGQPVVMGQPPVLTRATVLGRAVWVPSLAAALSLVVSTTAFSLIVPRAAAAPAVGSMIPAFPATAAVPAGGTQETSVRPRSAIVPSAIARPAISRSAVADFPPVPGTGNAVPTTGNAVPTTGNAVVSMMTLPGGDTPAENGPAKLWLRDAEGEWTPTVLLRKVVRIDGPISGSVQIFADSDYEIHCNGKLVAAGKAGDSGT